MGVSSIRQKAVVAIELGTRRSGWAFSLRGKAEGDTFIRVPEGNAQGEKTETAVLISPRYCDVLSFGLSARERYIDNKAAGRLFLDFVKDIRHPVAVAECGQTVSLRRLMAAVLCHFKTTALEHLSSACDVPIVVKDVAWVIAVPASYDTITRRLVRQAAFRSGIINTTNSSQLQLCDQLSAAYLAVYDQEPRDLRRAVGSKTMIFDCGASTVDIASYEIVSLNPVRLKEFALPMTGAWGSTCVDDAFTDWFKELIGEESYSRVCLTDSFFDLMKCWEDRKTKFEGKPEERVRLNMADIAAELHFDSKTFQVRLPISKCLYHALRWRNASTKFEAFRVCEIARLS